MMRSSAEEHRIPLLEEDDYGLRFSVIWSRELEPWQTLDECYFDEDGDGSDILCHPPVDTDEEPQMFFKYRIEIPD